jgi:hypothetical protein
MSALSLVSTESTRDRLTVSACNRERHIAQLGDGIATLAVRLHAATYELLVMLREFDACAGWNYGFLSCAPWLYYCTGIVLANSRDYDREDSTLATMPLSGGAMQFRAEL